VGGGRKTERGWHDPDDRVGARGCTNLLANDCRIRSVPRLPQRMAQQNAASLPCLCSCSVNSRPSIGLIPRSGSMLYVTSVPATSSGAGSSAKVSEATADPPISARVPGSRLSSSNCGHASRCSAACDGLIDRLSAGPPGIMATGEATWRSEP
jgi:hypothetical protein